MLLETDICRDCTSSWEVQFFLNWNGMAIDTDWSLGDSLRLFFFIDLSIFCLENKPQGVWRWWELRKITDTIQCYRKTPTCLWGRFIHVHGDKLIYVYLLLETGLDKHLKEFFLLWCDPLKWKVFHNHFLNASSGMCEQGRVYVIIHQSKLILFS